MAPKKKKGAPASDKQTSLESLDMELFKAPHPKYSIPPDFISSSSSPFHIKDDYLFRQQMVQTVFGVGDGKKGDPDSAAARVRSMFETQAIPVRDVVQIWSVAGLPASLSPLPAAHHALGCYGGVDGAMFISAKEMLLDLNMGLYGKKVEESTFSRQTVSEMLRVLFPHVKHCSKTGLGRISTLGRQRGDNVYLYAFKNDPNLYIHIADDDLDNRSPPGLVWQGLLGMPTLEGAVRYIVRGFTYEVSHSIDGTETLPQTIFHLAVTELTKKPKQGAAWDHVPPGELKEMIWAETDAFVVTCQGADFTPLP